MKKMIIGLLFPVCLVTAAPKKSPLPHESYEKGSIIYVIEHNGALVVAYKETKNSTPFIVESYDVECCTTANFQCRTVVAYQDSEYTLFGYPLYQRVITVEEIKGEDPRGIKHAPGGPIIVSARASGGTAIAAILGIGCAGLFYKLFAKVKELQAYQDSMAA